MLNKDKIKEKRRERKIPVFFKDHKFTPRVRRKKSVNKTKAYKPKNTIVRLKNTLRSRLNSALKKGRFNNSCDYAKYLGCSIYELTVYLESLFQPGMTWDNHGEWHLDHTISLSNAKTEEELYKYFHFTNIKPMWGIYNIQKNAKSPEEWLAYKLLHNIDESIPPFEIPIPVVASL